MIVVGLCSCRGAVGQGCTEIALAARVVRAKSLRELGTIQTGEPESYRLRLLRAYQRFRLNHQDAQAAEQLLRLLPRTEEEQQTVMSLGDSLCEEESLADMQVLATVQEGFARVVTDAVAELPSFLPAYLNYALVATMDPHSNYGVEARRVCRIRHSEFLKAVKGLPEQQRRALVEHVIQPRGCVVIAVPESE